MKFGKMIDYSLINFCLGMLEAVNLANNARDNRDPEQPAMTLLEALASNDTEIKQEIKERMEELTATTMEELTNTAMGVKIYKLAIKTRDIIIETIIKTANARDTNLELLIERVILKGIPLYAARTKEQKKRFTEAIKEAIKAGIEKAASNDIKLKRRIETAVEAVIFAARISAMRLIIDETIGKEEKISIAKSELENIIKILKADDNNAKKQILTAATVVTETIADEYYVKEIFTKAIAETATSNDIEQEELTAPTHNNNTAKPSETPTPTNTAKPSETLNLIKILSKKNYQIQHPVILLNKKNYHMQHQAIILETFQKILNLVTIMLKN